MKDADELKRRGEVERGARARQLLENQLFRDAWVEVERSLLDKIVAVPVPDKAGQEHELKLMVLALRMVRARIEKWAQTGSLAERELSNWERAKQRVRRGMGGR